MIEALNIAINDASRRCRRARARARGRRAAARVSADVPASVVARAHCLAKEALESAAALDRVYARDAVLYGCPERAPVPVAGHTTIARRVVALAIREHVDGYRVLPAIEGYRRFRG